MYKSVGVARAKGGKVREAVAAVKALAEHLKSKHDFKVEVYLQLFGPAGTIYAIGEFQGLASFEATNSKLMADEAAFALVQKGAELIDPSTMALLQPV